MPEVMKGLDRLIATCKAMASTGGPKAMRAGLNAALTVLAKAERQAINASSASPQMKRAARLTIGKRLKREGLSKSVFSGKAGFAVGKASKRKREKAIARAGDKSRRGVGISASNIHWPVLGTVERNNGGHSTGRMPASLKGLVNSAAQGALPAMLEAARAKTQQVLAAEAAKAKKG
jgi:hypothetical protein